MTELSQATTIRRRGAQGWERYNPDLVTVKADTEGGQVTIQIGRGTETMLLCDLNDLAAISGVIDQLVYDIEESPHDLTPAQESGRVSP